MFKHYDTGYNNIKKELKTMETLNLIGYCRVSTDNQKEEGTITGIK